MSCHVVAGSTSAQRGIQPGARPPTRPSRSLWRNGTAVGSRRSRRSLLPIRSTRVRPGSTRTEPNLGRPATPREISCRNLESPRRGRNLCRGRHHRDHPPGNREHIGFSSGPSAIHRNRSSTQSGAVPVGFRIFDYLASLLAACLLKNGKINTCLWLRKAAWGSAWEKRRNHPAGAGRNENRRVKSQDTCPPWDIQPRAVLRAFPP